MCECSWPGCVFGCIVKSLKVGKTAACHYKAEGNHASAFECCIFFFLVHVHVRSCWGLPNREEWQSEVPGFLGGPHASLHPCRMCRRWARLTQNRHRELGAQGARQASTAWPTWEKRQRREQLEREKERREERWPESPILPTFMHALMCVSKNRRTGTQLEKNNQEIKYPKGFGLLCEFVTCFRKLIHLESGSPNVRRCWFFWRSGEVLMTWIHEFQSFHGLEKFTFGTNWLLITFLSNVSGAIMGGAKKAVCWLAEKKRTKKLVIIKKKLVKISTCCVSLNGWSIRFWHSEQTTVTLRANLQN